MRRRRSDLERLVLFEVPLSGGCRAVGFILERIGDTLHIVLLLRRFTSTPTASRIMDELESAQVYETITGLLGFTDGGWEIFGTLAELPQRFRSQSVFVAYASRFYDGLANVEAEVSTATAPSGTRLVRYGVSGHGFVAGVLERMVDTGTLLPFLEPMFVD